MWQEYAIEPGALVRSLREFNVFNSGLGWEHGRLLVQVPGKTYKQLVYEALEASPEQPVKKSTILNRLSELYGRALVNSRRQTPAHGTWVDKALAAHGLDPFHAIIGMVTIGGVIGLDDFDPSAAPWTCGADRIVDRSVKALAATARSIFRHAPAVAIVDPHFAPHRGHVRTVLEAYLDSRDHTPGTAFRLSIHAARHVMERPPGQPPFSPSEFEQRVSKVVSGMLRSGQIVTVNVWEEIGGGERLHDRYILCEHGGLSIQGGADSGPAGESTTVSRVSPATACELLGRFERSKAGSPCPVFNLVCQFDVK